MGHSVWLDAWMLRSAAVAQVDHVRRDGQPLENTKNMFQQIAAGSVFDFLYNLSFLK